MQVMQSNNPTVVQYMAVNWRERERNALEKEACYSRIRTKAASYNIITHTKLTNNKWSLAHQHNLMRDTIIK